MKILGMFLVDDDHKARAGYVPNEIQSANMILGIRLMMFVASASLFIIILLIYLKFYKLNGSFYRNILDELVIMRKNNN